MKKWLLVVFSSALLNLSNAYAEEPLDFVKRYITEINQSSSPTTYSSYWREKTRTHLHNTAEKLQKELVSSGKIHRLFLMNGSLNIPPQIFEMQKNVISYTFKLNEPITVQKADSVALLYPEWVYKEFQITVEKEHGAWRVSGETFIGEEK